jgi:acyl carrier protein
MKKRTAKRIRRYIEEQLLTEPYEGADPLADGLLDSLDIEELVAYIEETYGVALTEDEIVPSNFANISVLAELVDVKRR